MIGIIMIHVVCVVAIVSLTIAITQAVLDKVENKKENAEMDKKKFARAIEMRAKIMSDYYLEKSGIKSIIKPTGKQKKGARHSR